MSFFISNFAADFKTPIINIRHKITCRNDGAKLLLFMDMCKKRIGTTPIVNFSKTLIINGLRTCKSGITVQMRFACVALAVFSLFLAACTTENYELELQLAEEMLWQDVDSCQQVLNGIPFEELTSDQQKAWQLCDAHAQLRKTGVCPNDSLLKELEEFFIEKDDGRHAGEACYVLGTCRLLENNYDEALYYLKEAEYCLTSCKVYPSQLLGIVYYRLGNTAEQDRMYDVANQFYEKAIPYLKQTDNYLYLSSVYRDYASTMINPLNEKANLLLDTAILYAQKLGDNALEMYARCVQLERAGASEEELLPLHHYICDTCHVYNHASNLIDYYLPHGDLQQVAYYLEILAQDTMNSAWSLEHYHYQQAAYLNAIREKDSAIHVLQRLHERQTQEIANHAYARTYTISQYYDLAVEQERRLQLQVERQRLYLLILALLLLGLVLIGIWYVRQQQARRRLVEQEKHIAVLQAQNKEKQQALIAQLHLRIQLSEQLRSSHKRKENVAEMPEWAQTMVDSLLFTGNTRAKQLRYDINNAYNNVLARLRAEFPLLTDADQTVCGLMIVGLDTKDICFLLDMSKDTLYTRHKRIKKHLGLGPDDELEAWLLQKV